MKFSNMLATAGEWLRGEGPHHQVVISSRVRLARNLRKRPFPGWAKKAERTSILELVRPRVEELPEMQDSFSESLQDLSALDRQVLVERHLISREHAAKGTGNIFQISNQTTLSEKEDDIINRLSKVIETIIEKEHDARQVLLQKKPAMLSDQIGRAYGVLTYAHAMASKEALNLLSVIKLGMDLGAFPEDQRLQIDELFIETQPAHLQKSSQQKLNAEERDHLRAEIIRERLKLFPKPDISKMARQSGGDSIVVPSDDE